MLRAVAEAWAERRQELERQAGEIDDTLRRGLQLRPSSEPLTSSLLAEAARGIARTFEPVVRRLRARAEVPRRVDARVPPRAAATKSRSRWSRATLDGMAAGGMYDIVGGGFHRYSVDDRWLVPHFEKMLYDNAVLASAYLHAWVVTGGERYREVVEETLDYLLREMLAPGGGLASAQDADTDGVEGLTYTWTREEAAAVGLSLALVDALRARATDRPGRARPRAPRPAARRSASARPQPFRDDKALASWNGLALAAFADAGIGSSARLGRGRTRARGVPARTALGRGRDGFCRSVRDGRVSGAGFLDDYANIANGLLELHVATGELR